MTVHDAKRMMGDGADKKGIGTKRGREWGRLSDADRRCNREGGRHGGNGGVESSADGCVRRGACGAGTGPAAGACCSNNV